MSTRRTLPPAASVAHETDGAKLYAPSAERNAGPIAGALQEIAPETGRALEIASGTGQHAVAFARAMPGLSWHPTEIDAARRASIDAYVAEAALPNLAPSRSLDATAPGWGADHAGQDMVVLVNLLHLVSTQEARTVVQEAAQALAPGGWLAIYGPFLRDGQATSEGDARFDASLRAQDPEIGYKDVAEVEDWLGAAGLAPAAPRGMPANNLLLTAQRPA
jgi:SAM-dependent methyltransferase